MTHPKRGLRQPCQPPWASGASHRVWLWQQTIPVCAKINLRPHQTRTRSVTRSNVLWMQGHRLQDLQWCAPTARAARRAPSVAVGVARYAASAHSAPMHSDGYARVERIQHLSHASAAGGLSLCSQSWPGSTVLDTCKLLTATDVQL
jgi:hypothetical protein